MSLSAEGAGLRTGRGWPVAGLLATLQLLAAHPLPAVSGVGDPVQGQSIFVTKGCVRCHAVRGTGGRIASDLGRTPAKGSFFDIAARMWNHSGMMGEKMEEFRTPRPSFEDDELAHLIAFLYFLNYFDEPGDPRVGKVLFTEKHCVQCHQLGGEGGTDGPGLDDLPRGTSPLRIAQDLWNHGPAMITSMRRRGLAVPVFNDDEIIDLFAYLRSQGRRQKTREFQSAGDPEQGRLLFESTGCLRCHQVFGAEPGIGPDLGTAELRGSVTQLAGRMWNHLPAMAEDMTALDMGFPDFEGDELAEIFAYLFISRYDGERGDATRGRDQFEAKGCAACHGLHGEGRGVGMGPAIRDTTTGAPKESIVQLMWNHAPEMGKRMASKQLEWPRFTARELADLLTFLAEAWSAPPEGPDP